MGNSLQSNPSDATHEFVQPDWNTSAGEGVAPASDDKVDLAENYDAQRAEAKARAEAKTSSKMAGDNTE